MGTAQVMTVIRCAHTQLCTCSQCLAFRQPRLLYPFRWDIACLTSSLSAEQDWSSTRSLTQSPASKISCSEHLLSMLAMLSDQSLSNFSVCKDPFLVACLFDTVSWSKKK